MAVFELEEITVYENELVEEVPSNVKAFGHPVHPMLVTFPLAFLSITFANDMLAKITGRRLWARMAVYSLRAGIASGLLAAGAGAVDFFTQEKIRRHDAARYHLFSMASAISLAALNLLGRRGNDDKPASTGSLILSLLTNAVLMIGGWFGGELVYRCKIGIESAKKR